MVELIQKRKIKQNRLKRQEIAKIDNVVLLFDFFDFEHKKRPNKGPSISSSVREI
jgi:hypothetical protein